MATITSQINLSGTGLTSDDLSITNTSILDVTNPVVESGTMNVTTTSTPILSSLTGDTYLYIKNTGEGLSASVDLQFLGGGTIARIAPGDWCFLPVVATANLNVVLASSSGASTIEYSIFTSA
jgi:hypothetical protein